MNSDLYALCKAILIWWESIGFQDHYDNGKPMPDFVKEALEMLGRVIVNMDDEEIEE